MVFKSYLLCSITFSLIHASSDMCDSFKWSSNNDTTTHLEFCDWLEK
jgi:hypothetical protein